MQCKIRSNEKSFLGLHKKILWGQTNKFLFFIVLYYNHGINSIYLLLDPQNAQILFTYVCIDVDVVEEVKSGWLIIVIDIYGMPDWQIRQNGNNISYL